jgi:hypothetical protein
MWSDDWLDSLYLHRGVVRSVDPSDLIRELVRQRSEALANELRPLDQLILRETTAAILHNLRPRERAIAVLRLEGLNDGQIARILGIERSTVTGYMRRAQQRIMAEVPGAASLLADRQRVRGGLRPPDAPLERGWLCSWDDDLDVDPEPGECRAHDG